MLPTSVYDRYAPTEKAVEESAQIRESYRFMKRRDALLGACEKLYEKLKVDRLRLYEFDDSPSFGPLFRGTVEIGGVYANFVKLELPLAADWYSQRTIEQRRNKELIAYHYQRDDSNSPPKYRPSAFWKEKDPSEWADILLMHGGKVIGKISVDNYSDLRPLPTKTGDVSQELDAVIVELRRDKFPEGDLSDVFKADRRRVLLSDLTEVLQSMVAECSLDRARAYEFVAGDGENRFEARAGVGGKYDHVFSKFEQPFHLSTGREDPISFLTFGLRKADVYRRDDVKTYTKGKHGPERIHILFKCDDKVNSENLKCLMDIPLVISDKIVGKITVDNIFRDPHGKDKSLDELLRDDGHMVAHFAEMAARAIERANSMPSRPNIWGRLVRKRKALSDRTWTLIVAIFAGAAGGGTSCLVRWLVGVLGT